jgi:hypothetical protein
MGSVQELRVVSCILLVRRPTSSAIGFYDAMRPALTNLSVFRWFYIRQTLE